jgi:hypothetical protein
MSIANETNDGVKCVEFSAVIKVDEGKVRQHLEEVVRQSVEETLNDLLEAKADELCGAKRCERSPERLDIQCCPPRRLASAPCNLGSKPSNALLTDARRVDNRWVLLNHGLSVYTNRGMLRQRAEGGRKKSRRRIEEIGKRIRPFCPDPLTPGR